jgi:MFS family permease
MNRALSKPVSSIIFARIVYTINWFNIASIFYIIALDFKENISGLGLITASFLIGVGLFQVPAGILAAKYHPQKIAIFGIFLASSATILIVICTDLLQIALLRFVVGIGMACFFGPSVILISKFLGKGSEGLGIGFLNSAHASGGIIALFGWIVLASIEGWKISLVLSGAMGLISAFTLVATLPWSSNGKIPTFKIKLSDISKTLFNKSLVILGCTLLGFQAGASLILVFSIFYFVSNLKLDPLMAGFVGSLSLIPGLVFSPLFGRIYDRYGNARELLLLAGILSGISMMGIASGSFYIIIISIIASGILLSAGFVIIYAKAKHVNELRPQYQTLSVSFVNGFSLFGAFWTPLLFSFIVNRAGYSIAWLISGFLVIILILPVIKLKDK